MTSLTANADHNQKAKIIWGNDFKYGNYLWDEQPVYIPQRFLEYWHKLEPKLQPNELAFIFTLIGIMYKTEIRTIPYSALTEQMNITKRALITIKKSLEKKEYIKVIHNKGEENTYSLEPLYKKLCKIADTETSKWLDEEINRLQVDLTGE